MEEGIKKRTTKYSFPGRTHIYLIVLFAISIAFILYIINIKNSMLMEMEIVENRIEQLEDKYNEINKQRSLALISTLKYVNDTSKEVIFSNYGTWDSHSGNITASGLTTNDFKVNADGMYTYQNKVVLATANTTRLPYQLQEGFNSHNLFEELDISINGKEYQAIVLDVCGTCTWGKANEDKQRYDIFTTSNVIALQEGFIYE